MSTIMSMHWDGVSPEQYDQVRKIVNWEGNPPAGGIFHVAGFKDDALRVTDLWESEEALSNFVQNRLMPGVAEAGIQTQPQVETFPTHAIFVPNAQKLKE